MAASYIRVRLIRAKIRYVGPKFYEIVISEQSGTGFWPIIPYTIWHQTFAQKITIWTYKGLTLLTLKLRYSKPQDHKDF